MCDQLNRVHRYRGIGHPFWFRNEKAPFLLLQFYEIEILLILFPYKWFSAR